MNDKLTRRRFISLGAAMGAGAAMVACGAGNSTGSGASSSSSGSSAIAARSGVKTASAVTFQDGGQPAVLIHLNNGNFVAYSAVCTHQGCTVAYRNGELACPCHGSVFDPANNGTPINGPATQPLPKIPIQIRGGEIYKA